MFAAPFRPDAVRGAFTTPDRGNPARAHRGPAAPGRLGAGRLRPAARRSFATADIFATAEAIDRLGGATVQVSNNYYDDLIARFALPGDEDRAAAPARASSTTETRTAASCCTCTPPVYGGRVFFEILQRRGGHDGYGELNAPVRMAAPSSPAALLRMRPGDCYSHSPAAGLGEGNSMRILLVRAAGAPEKGTQGALIATHFGIPHIATGDPAA